MGDKDVDRVRNESPFFCERCTAGKIEGPIVELRLPRASIEVNAINGEALVDEDREALAKCAGSVDIRFKTAVVVAGY